MILFVVSVRETRVKKNFNSVAVEPNSATLRHVGASKHGPRSCRTPLWVQHSTKDVFGPVATATCPQHGERAPRHEKETGVPMQEQQVLAEVQRKKSEVSFAVSSSLQTPHESFESPGRIATEKQSLGKT
jgi:hypothetical protein